LGHGHVFSLGDYVAQIRWGLNYIAGRYGSPAAAWGHELSAGWYDRGGFLPPGLSLSYNGTGRPEKVSSPGSEDRLIAEVRRMVRAVEQMPAHTGRTLGEVLNRGARSAAYSGHYGG
jgi:hypothetical protein